MGNMLRRNQENLNTEPIITEYGEYNPNERTRRLIAMIEARFGRIDEYTKVKNIGKRDFSRIDLQIFQFQQVQNFYKEVYEMICAEYDDINQYLIENLQIQKPFLYLLYMHDRPLLYKIIREYGDKL